MKKDNSIDLRGYQKNFYELHQGVQNSSERKKKAEKIHFLLTNRINFPLKQASALDIGCSSGVLTCALSELFEFTIGLEFDETALQKRPLSDCQVIFIQGDALQLPISDESINIIICAQVYEHVPNDMQLACEMFRVLTPGGFVFFSGPNKLYPIEPHYFLPFLHWLPTKLADKYLTIFKNGDHYYEKSRTIWGLKKLFKDFQIVDLSLDVLHRDLQESTSQIYKLLRILPLWFWEALLPFIPNYNWLLIKPGSDARQSINS